MTRCASSTASTFKMIERTKLNKNLTDQSTTTTGRLNLLELDFNNLAKQVYFRHFVTNLAVYLLTASRYMKDI